MNNKLTSIAVLAVAALFSILIIVIIGQNPQNDTPQHQNVYEENGKQIIEITAKGGYRPRATEAKAGVATMLRIKTNSTFDCSSAIMIPAIKYRARLMPSGITEVEIPPQQAGKSIRGLCAMGMYSFNITFQ